MQRNTLHRLFAATAISSIGMVAALNAGAVPISGVYVEDSRCDVVPNQSLKHEIGIAAIFPGNEAITYFVTPAQFTVCVPNDGLANDWIVNMTNVSTVFYQDLFFVADLGVTVGNSDGSVFDAVLAPGVVTDAFRIDGTVTAGVNMNLLGESFAFDEIFAPGETWRFAVSNYGALNSAGQFAPPDFLTPGIFAGSSPFGQVPGNASILANEVIPEPGTISVLLVAGGMLLLRRPRRA